MSRARDLAAFVSNADGDIKFDTDTLFIDSSANRVGILNTTPSHALDVTQTGATSARVGGTGGSGANDGTIIINNGGTGDAMLRFDYETNTDRARIGTSTSSQQLEFYTAGDNERMRIDNSGNVLVSKTTADNTTEGHVLYSSGLHTVVKDGGTVQILNRLSSDGEIINLRKDGTSFGAIGVVGGNNTYIRGDNIGLGIGDDNLYPTNHLGASNDNAVDLGDSSVRFDDVFATNGTIQTSDENEKQNIASLSSAEITAATAISKLFKTFKWKDKVAAKGDDARTHIGVVAQQVQTAMSDAGLDASNYAFWCSDTWTNDDGNEQTRMGIRYPELLAFIGAATEQRLTSIESRLDALEAE
jgi:hypothetical protein